MSFLKFLWITLFVGVFVGSCVEHAVEERMNKKFDAKWAEYTRDSVNRDSKSSAAR